MADTAQQLKRKRESLPGSQKKSKKQRKSEAHTAQDAGLNGDIVATTTATGARPQSPAVSKAHETSKGQSRKSKADAAREDAVASTPSGVEQDSKAADSLPNGAQDATEAKPTSADTPLKQSKKERKALAKATKDVQEVESSKSQLSKPKKQKNKHAATWALSPAQGSWFLPIDPIFSLDEKYLLLANPKNVQIYFTETSLLASVLPVGTAGFVTAYALSSTQPHRVYVADSNGLITLWDWVEGTKVGRWDIGVTVRNMAVITQPGSDEDLVYCHEVGSSHTVSVHALRTKSQASKTELKRVLKTPSSITSIQVLLEGRYVVISTPESMLVGKRVKVTKTALHDFEYVWRELKFAKRITTCSSYLRLSVKDQRDVLDVAVGDEIGVVLLFEDILAGFAMIELGQKGNKSRTDNAESLRPKLLHWHRDAVGSVKWSLDGNYLISGGDETVLTIWQLTTGKPQHLPHLTAAIENIVVSPSGSSYALSLANNSVIILSTTELEAKTNIIGIQTRRVNPEQLPKRLNHAGSSTHILQSVPLIMDPVNAQHVLFTVPSSQPRQRNEGLRPEPYLQTYDIANQRAVTRQAMTRNNATDTNMAPDGRRIAEPNVDHLQISYDGQYLATIDEWTPPKADAAYLNEGNDAISEEERLLRREVYLKIWRRDEKNGQWSLETRIDSPHMVEDLGRNSRVLGLAAHPTVQGFATIGEDHVVRIWKPKTRLRDGIVVRGADKRGLINWSLSQSIELPNPDKLWLSEGSPGSEHPRQYRLAFSADGSILAAAVSGTSQEDRGLVHLIDANAGTIRRSMTEIDLTVLCGVGIVGRHLVVVSDCITVWDLVDDDLAYVAPFSTEGLDPSESVSVVRLAVNEVGGTFAVSLPQFEKAEAQASRIKRVSSKILIFGTEQKEPIWSHNLPAITLALAARKGKGEKGYVALDSISCIRTITPAAGRLAVPAPQAAEESAVERNEDDLVEEVDNAEDNAASRALENLMLENEYDKPVVTHQDLENIFHNDNAPQAPKDVFSAVIGLFGGVAKAAA
ncbi:hypothetical protein FB567DRAFT_524496 [Paraphoma chrysanthemicola]|uniref:WD40 repeat-like protein n=1 Tax=Paraphoma chrysanthemicola TaxID=798071 RepID=A0A8K0R9I9_9PLEO|nr:hypothetical protein FB567DRAFT_524496 [Paraphoma chrysanthemicola]